ncbi:hypothetical protein G4228_019096 [Cervus hanglu yarkandensis]|nr:hypothetical protein G4228_019096 [Cervus hanglu yarkandensis]
MRQNFVTQFVEILNHWLCDIQLGVVVEKNWTLSVDQCRLQALQFSVHLIDLLNILLRCNGFAGIQKAEVDRMGRRPPGASLALGNALELLFSPTTELVITGCHMSDVFSLHIRSKQNIAHCCHTEQEDDTSK